MPSNYKRLGDYIQEVNIRNTDLKINKLIGVSIEKKFISSVANIVGTDMSVYKVIKKNQLACKLMSVGRDEKLPVDLYLSDEPAIISSAYYVFESKNNKVLLPEYLKMWLFRKETDRYVGYISGGDVRGGISWDTFCDMPIIIPSVEKQQEIVREYNTIQNRIALNNQLISKLEETAQSIYKQWFVDFEFPFDFAQSKPISGTEALEVPEKPKGYKSAGGKMVWCEELEKEIPEGWEVEKLGKLIESFSRKHSFKKKELIFFNTSDILDGEFLHENYMNVDEMPGQAKKQIQLGDILYSEIRPANKRFALVRIDADDYVVSTKLMVLRRINNKLSINRIYHLLTEDSFILELQQSAEGRSGTFPQITFEEDLDLKPIIIATEIIEDKWNKFLEAYYIQLFSRKDETKKLKEIKDLLLAKMTRGEN